MILNFNTITDKRGEEIAELFDQFIDEVDYEITNEEGLVSFVEKYIDTPEELVIATMLFTKLNPI